MKYFSTLKILLFALIIISNHSLFTEQNERQFTVAFLPVNIQTEKELYKQIKNQMESSAIYAMNFSSKWYFLPMRYTEMISMVKPKIPISSKNIKNLNSICQQRRIDLVVYVSLQFYLKENNDSVKKDNKQIDNYLEILVYDNFFKDYVFHRNVKYKTRDNSFVIKSVKNNFKVLHNFLVEYPYNRIKKEMHRMTSPKIYFSTNLVMDLSPWYKYFGFYIRSVPSFNLTVLIPIRITNYFHTRVDAAFYSNIINDVVATIPYNGIRQIDSFSFPFSFGLGMHTTIFGRFQFACSAGLGVSLDFYNIHYSTGSFKNHVETSPFVYFDAPFLLYVYKKYLIGLNIRTNIVMDFNAVRLAMKDNNDNTISSEHIKQGEIFMNYSIGVILFGYQF